MSSTVLEHVDVFYEIFDTGVQRRDKDQHPAYDRNDLRSGEPGLGSDDENAERDHRDAGLDLSRPSGGNDYALLDCKQSQTRNAELTQQNYRNHPSGHKSGWVVAVVLLQPPIRA